MITVKQGRTIADDIKITEGMRFDRGYFLLYLIMPNDLFSSLLLCTSFLVIAAVWVNGDNHIRIHLMPNIVNVYEGSHLPVHHFSRCSVPVSMAHHIPHQGFPSSSDSHSLPKTTFSAEYRVQKHVLGGRGGSRKDQECKLLEPVSGCGSTLVPGFLEWVSARYDQSRSARVLLQSRLDMPWRNINAVGRAASGAFILYAPHMPFRLECQYRDIQRFWHIYSISTPLSHGSRSLVQTSAAFSSSVFHHSSTFQKLDKEPLLVAQPTFPHTGRRI